LNEASSIGPLLGEFVARGAFGSAAPSSRRRGVEVYRIVWFRGQQMELSVNARQARVSLRHVLPPVTPRSASDRRLRAWLRSREAAELPAHRRLDPRDLRASLRNAGGDMQLTLVSRTGDTVLAVRRLLHLVNELYLGFLATPECYDWIVEAFELDPDRPRWP
jgi:hypothetical protein